MNQDYSLSVVIPAYNEEENLRELLPRLISHCREMGWKIVLVNDGSKDKTKSFLETLSEESLLKVVHHKLNKGYGAALKSGIRACETSYLITFDADGQHDMNDIDNLFNCLKVHDADMVVGSRKGLKSANHFRTVGKMIIRLLARILMTVPIHDINSGMKIYRSDLAKKYLFLLPNTMSFSDVITLIFINNRHLVLEEPIRINPRTKGESTIGLQTAFQTVMEIINIVVLFNPMKIFLPLATIIFIVTMAWGIPLALQGRGVSTGSLLGLVAAMLFFLLGLITEQLSQIRRNPPE
jgi:glycosyltransferase involved in cell wall biosynthesis